MGFNKNEKEIDLIISKFFIKNVILNRNNIIELISLLNINEIISTENDIQTLFNFLLESEMDLSKNNVKEEISETACKSAFYVFFKEDDNEENLLSSNNIIQETDEPLLTDDIIANKAIIEKEINIDSLEDIKSIIEYLFSDGYSSNNYKYRYYSLNDIHDLMFKDHKEYEISFESFNYIICKLLSDIEYININFDVKEILIKRIINEIEYLKEKKKKIYEEEKILHSQELNEELIEIENNIEDLLIEETFEDDYLTNERISRYEKIISSKFKLIIENHNKNNDNLFLLIDSLRFIDFIVFSQIKPELKKILDERIDQFNANEEIKYLFNNINIYSDKSKKIKDIIQETKTIISKEEILYLKLSELFDLLIKEATNLRASFCLSNKISQNNNSNSKIKEEFNNLFNEFNLKIEENELLKEKLEICEKENTILMKEKEKLNDEVKELIFENEKNGKIISKYEKKIDENINKINFYEKKMKELNDKEIFINGRMNEIEEKSRDLNSNNKIKDRISLTENKYNLQIKNLQNSISSLSQSLEIKNNIIENLKKENDHLNLSIVNYKEKLLFSENELKIIKKKYFELSDVSNKEKDVIETTLENILENNNCKSEIEITSFFFEFVETRKLKLKPKSNMNLIDINKTIQFKETHNRINSENSFNTNESASKIGRFKSIIGPINFANNNIINNRKSMLFSDKKKNSREKNEEQEKLIKKLHNFMKKSSKKNILKSDTSIIEVTENSFREIDESDHKIHSENYDKNNKVYDSCNFIRNLYLLNYLVKSNDLPSDNIIFSCETKVIIDKKNKIKENMKILITKNNLYLLDYINVNIKYIFSLERIYQIYLSTNYLNLMIIELFDIESLILINSQNILMIEYISQRNMKSMIKISLRNEIQIQNTKYLIKKNCEDFNIEEANEYVGFINSYKHGIVNLEEKSLFGEIQYKRKYICLSEIGLTGFDIIEGRIIIQKPCFYLNLMNSLIELVVFSRFKKNNKNIKSMNDLNEEELQLINSDSLRTQFEIRFEGKQMIFSCLTTKDADDWIEKINVSIKNISLKVFERNFIQGMDKNNEIVI